MIRKKRARAGEREACFIFAASPLSVAQANALLKFQTRRQVQTKRMVDQLYEESAVLKQITEFYDQQMPERNHQLCT